jgi:hypothetical protein
MVRTIFGHWEKVGDQNQTRQDERDEGTEKGIVRVKPKRQLENGQKEDRGFHSSLIAQGIENKMREKTFFCCKCK